MVLANSRKNAMKKILLIAIMFASVSSTFAQAKKSTTKNSKTTNKKYVASIDQRTKKASDTLRFYSSKEDSLRLMTDSMDLVVLDSTRQAWLDSMYTVVDAEGVQQSNTIFNNRTARENKETAVINSLRSLKLSNAQLSRVRPVISSYYDEVDLISSKEDLMEAERNQRIITLDQDRDLKLKAIIGGKNLKKWLKNNTEEPNPSTKEQ